MRDLNECYNYCIKLFDALGIEYGNIVEVKINNRAKTRFAQCCKINGCKKNWNEQEFSINVNSALLDENVNINSLYSSIVHEICHSCEDCFDHKNKWKEYADLFNDCYSFLNIKRCSTYEEKGIERPKKKVYSCECEHCGKIYKRVGYRQPKWFAHSERFYCTPCYNKGYSGKLINKKIENVS